jgi:hypothetical protein
VALGCSVNREKKSELVLCPFLKPPLKMDIILLIKKRKEKKRKEK